MAKAKTAAVIAAPATPAVHPTNAQAAVVATPTINGKAAMRRTMQNKVDGAKGNLPLDAVLALTGVTSPWQKPTTAGYQLFGTVIFPMLQNGATATVGEICTAAKAKLNMPQGATLGHLKWLFIKGPYATANGALFPTWPQAKASA